MGAAAVSVMAIATKASTMTLVNERENCIVAIRERSENRCMIKSPLIDRYGVRDGYSSSGLEGRRSRRNGSCADK
jgi:hypothetical protein